MTEIFAHVCAGSAAALVIQGESGIGKSALVQQWITKKTQQDPHILTLFGRCYERESLSYKAFDGIMDELARVMGSMPSRDVGPLMPRAAALLGQVFPVLSKVREVAEAPDIFAGLTLDAQERRFRLLLAVRELFTRLADRRRVVLVIDDLQWADAESLILLDELLREPEAPRLLILGTRRPPGAEAQGTLPKAVKVISLSSLKPEESRELALQLLGDSQASHAKVERLALEGAGHPLFIQELVQYTLERTTGEYEVIRLDDALLSRIRGLSPEAQAVLEAVSVAGTPRAQSVIQGVVGQESTDFFGIVGALRSQKLVKTTGPLPQDTIEPYHDRVRESLTNALPADKQQSIHKSLAQTLESLQANDIEALMRHWEGAGDLEKSIQYALQAAETAEKTFAFSHAADLYKKILAHYGENHPQSRTTKIKLAEALANAGYGAEAADYFLSTVTGSDAKEALYLKHRATEQLTRTGHFDRGFETAKEVLRPIGLKMPSILWSIFCFILWRFSFRFQNYPFKLKTNINAFDLEKINIVKSISVGLASQDTLRGAYFMALYIRYSLKSGNALHIAYSLYWDIVVVALENPEKNQKIKKIFDLLKTIKSNINPKSFSALNEWSEALRHLFQGYWKKCTHHAINGLNVLPECPERYFHEMIICMVNLIWAQYFLGEIKLMKSNVLKYMQFCNLSQDLYFESEIALGPGSTTWIIDDTPSDAILIFKKIIQKWPNKMFLNQHALELWSEIHVDLYLNEGTNAYDTLISKWPSLKWGMYFRMIIYRAWFSDLRSRAALASALESAQPQRSKLIKEAKQFSRKLEKEEMPGFRVFHWILDGCVAYQEGQQEKAAAYFRKGVEEHEAQSMILHANVARYRLGQVIGGEEGAALTAQATAWMQDQGIVRPDRWAFMLAPMRKDP